MEDNLKNAIEQMKRGEEKGFNTVYWNLSKNDMYTTLYSFR